MRRRKSSLNFLAILLNKVTTISLGLVLPRLFIANFGSEVNGLLSSVTNLFVYINLLEGGVGLASIQALYGPVANRDSGRVDSILAATACAYRKVGVYVLACVVGTAFLYPLAADTSINYWTIVLVILLQGSVTVLDYFVQAKNRVLLQAEAKNYVIYNINTAFHIVTSLTKVVLILYGLNVVVIQASFCLVNVLRITVFQIYIGRKYPHIDIKATPDFASIEKKKYAFIHNTVYVISCNVDVLVITFCLGMEWVSVYTIYCMIYSAVTMVLEALVDGVNSSFGQLYQQQHERFVKLYRAYEVVFGVLVFTLLTVACVLTPSFIALYTKGIHDVDYLIAGLPVAFTITELLNKMRLTSTKVISYAGHFRQTMKPAVIEIVVNVSLSVILSIRFGIVGVVAATSVSSLYRLIWFTEYVNKALIQDGYRNPYLRWLVNGILAGICVYTGHHMVPPINGYGSLVLWGLVATAAGFCLFVCANALLTPDTARYVKMYITQLRKRGITA